MKLCRLFVFLFILLPCQFIFAATTILNGKITIDGKELPIKVQYTSNGSSTSDQVEIDKKVYKLNDVARENLGGSRVITI